VSESAASDKPLLVYGLARNRRSPKRPSEPRGQAAPTRRRAKSGKTRRSLPFKNDRSLLGIGSQHTVGKHEN